MGFCRGFLCGVWGLLSATGGVAGEVYPHTYLSYQGFTGIFGVPNAYVSEAGTADLLYNNHTDARRTDPKGGTDNYLVSFGAWPSIEGGMRLSEDHSLGVRDTSVDFGPTGNLMGIRDLSANIKVQVPFLPDWAPKVAFGMQDVGGAVPYFRSRYVVSSYPMRSFLLSLGYGKGPDRLNGLFGGVEWQATDWLQVLGEHDTLECSLGLRFLTPSHWLPGGARFGMLIRQGLGKDTRRRDVGFTLKALVGVRSKRLHGMGQEVANGIDSSQTPIQPSLSQVFLAERSPAQPTTALPVKVVRDANVDHFSHELKALEKQLVEQGFENVRVGVNGTALVVAYENHRFNHNELDALGLVLGTLLVQAPKGIERFECRVLRQQIQVLHVAGNIAPFRLYFEQNSQSLSPSQLAEALQMKRGASESAVNWQGPPSNTSPLRARLALSPGFDTAVGTELGVLDYRLSLVPELRIDLWKGATLNFRWDIPFSCSDDYKKGGAYDTQGNSPYLDQAMFRQAFALAPGLLLQVGGGKWATRVSGWVGEAAWTPGEGRHGLHISGGRLWPEWGERKDVLLATYRYYLAPLDSVFTVSYGQFYQQDHGYRVELKRFVGDTALSVYYAKTSHQFAGFTLALPLTPRRDMRPGIVQVTGADRWSYGLYSVIKDPTGRNMLVPSAARGLGTPYGIDRAYTNADRLSPAYIREHLPRLREAYLRWK